MEITISDKKLSKVINDDRKLKKEYGEVRAKIIKKRLEDLEDALTLEDVRDLPGRYHELVGDRKGEWACDLGHPYRMIFIPHEDPIPTDEHGRYIWIEIKGVEVTEITDYH